MKRLIISDFSKTLTSSEGKTTWSLFALSELMPEEYVVERQKLYDEYRPYEVAGDNEKVWEWFSRHLDLLEKYGAEGKAAEVLEISKMNGYIASREGLLEFVDWIKSQETTEFQILSSGITELVREFMKPYGLTMAYPQSWHGRGLQANDIVKSGESRNVQIPNDKHIPVPPEGDDIEIIVLGDSPDDFSISSGSFGTSKKLRGFSFSDEAPKGVVTLGKNASLLEVIRAVEGV